MNVLPLSHHVRWEAATYILTAELDPESFTWLDGLRREHFLPERNLTSPVSQADAGAGFEPARLVSPRSMSEIGTSRRN
jgi:hypothetical protein